MNTSPVFNCCKNNSGTYPALTPTGVAGYCKTCGVTWVAPRPRGSADEG